MEIIYNLRNRPVYSHVQSSVVDDLYKFINHYKELLEQEHHLVISQLKHLTLIEAETIKSVFRYLLNFVEIQILKWRNPKYVIKEVLNTPSDDLFLINEKIYFHRMNYICMKRDLYAWYKNHIDPEHKYIDKFLKRFPDIKNTINIQFDDAQLMLENNILFGL